MDDAAALAQALAAPAPAPAAEPLPPADGAPLPLPLEAGDFRNEDELSDAERERLKRQYRCARGLAASS